MEEGGISRLTGFSTHCMRMRMVLFAQYPVNALYLYKFIYGKKHAKIKSSTCIFYIIVLFHKRIIIDSYQAYKDSPNNLMGPFSKTCLREPTVCAFSPHFFLKNRTLHTVHSLVFSYQTAIRRGGRYCKEGETLGVPKLQ